MSRRRFLVLMAASLLALQGCGFFETAAAVVNGRRIEREEFERVLRFVLADPRFADSFVGEEGVAQRKDLTRQLLTFLIQVEIFKEYARDRDIDVSEDEVTQALEAQIAFQGGEEAFRQQLEEAEATEEDARGFVRDQLLSERVAEAVVEEELGEERLRQEFEARLPEFTRVDVTHILLPSLQEAEQIKQRATPANFGRLAEQFSIDRQSAAEGGELGLRPASDYVEEFAAAVLQAPVGRVAGPVETQFGFHVFIVLERIATPFEEAGEQLRLELQAEVFTDWLTEQLSTAEIRVNPRYGAFDAETGSVIERRATTPEAPPVQLTP
jgi:parvulin-like peptidyl-prolyl isomerase